MKSSIRATSKESAKWQKSSIAWKISPFLTASANGWPLCDCGDSDKRTAANGTWRLKYNQKAAKILSSTTKHVESITQAYSFPAYVKSVIEYINANYSREVNLDELASLCGITKFHLAREFRKITGQTILTYTNILRCKKASVLIAEGKTVTEAALDCGFDSLSYFSRTYKKIMGNPPSKKDN